MPRSRYGVRIQRSAPLRLSPNPESPKTESWRRWVKRQSGPLAVDLFSGCGGLSLGLEQAGFQVALAVDHEAWALETHRHNFAGPALDLDLGDPARVAGLIAMLKAVPIDLIAGGPPCQPFSRAGRSKIRSLVAKGARSLRDPRANLWRSFLDVVVGVRPKAAIMENVPDMALGDDLATVRHIAEVLRKEGYEVHARLLDAWRFGVPQHRQRLILVALRDGRPFEWPKERDPVTLRDAIGDLPPLRDSIGSTEMRARKPTRPFQKRARAGMGLHSGIVWDHYTRPVRTDDREAFQLMEAGTRYHELPKRYRRYRSDIFNDKYNRLAWDDLSRSITAHIAKDGYWYIHPSEHRTLTVREAARIQTFPDRFRFAGTRSNAFEQIGNAVPPTLAERIAGQLASALRSAPLPKPLRPSARQELVRGALIDWVKEDRRRHPWRHHGNIWSATIGAVLAPRHPRDVSFADEFLGAFPDAAACDGRQLRSFSARPGRRVEAASTTLLRVAREMRRVPDPKRDTSWIERSRLSAAERIRIRAVALGDDTVLASKQVLRVVGRVSGAEEQCARNVSEGKMYVADIVGSGRDVPKVNGALEALGAIVCTTRKPDCSACPLETLCSAAR